MKDNLRQFLENPRHLPLPITKEDFVQWKYHPVTQLLMECLRLDREQYIEMLTTGHTLGFPDAHQCLLNTGSVVSRVAMLDELREVTFGNIANRLKPEAFNIDGTEVTDE